MQASVWEQLYFLSKTLFFVKKRKFKQKAELIRYATLAQLVEQLIRNQQVGSSNLLGGSCLVSSFP